MANEVTASGSLAYDDSLAAADLAVSAKEFNSAGKLVYKGVQTIPITEVALEVGGISNVGAFFIKNIDPTNFVEVRVATAGAKFAKLAADVAGTGKGGFVMGTEMGGGAQAPFLIADTAPCKVAVLVVEL